MWHCWSCPGYNLQGLQRTAGTEAGNGDGDVITVVQTLFEKIYKNNEYRDLWFYWDGKPLLLYNSEPWEDANGGSSRDCDLKALDLVVK